MQARSQPPSSPTCAPAVASANLSGPSRVEARVSRWRAGTHFFSQRRTRPENSLNLSAAAILRTPDMMVRAKGTRTHVQHTPAAPLTVEDGRKRKTHTNNGALSRMLRERRCFGTDERALPAQWRSDRRDSRPAYKHSGLVHTQKNVGNRACNTGGRKARQNSGLQREQRSGFVAQHRQQRSSPRRLVENNGLVVVLL